MHPTLFHLGALAVPTYGVAMAAGYLSAVLLAMRSARRSGVSGDLILDLSFWLLGAALLGSRLTFVVVHAGEYVELCAGQGPSRTMGRAIADCTRALQLWEGGFVFFGGFALAAPVALWFARRRGVPFAKLADVVIPSLALGHFFGRMGCFAAGCCYGKPTHSALGVAFPAGSLAHGELVQGGQLPRSAAATMPLHPTQLYEALAELSLFVLLTLQGARKRYQGQLLVTYLGLYPLLRATIELLRGDVGRGTLVRLHTPTLNGWLGLPPDSVSLVSVSQGFALLAVSGALLLRARYRRAAP